MTFKLRIEHLREFRLNTENLNRNKKKNNNLQIRRESCSAIKRTIKSIPNIFIRNSTQNVTAAKNAATLKAVKSVA